MNFRTLSPNQCLSGSTAAWAGILVLLSSCGPIGLGGSATLDEDPPEGMVLYQGTFAELNGSGVSGLASVILATANFTTVIHLDSLTGVDASSARVDASLDGTRVTISALRAREGSQNYTTSYDSNHLWSDVRIHDPVTGDDLAVALLDKVNE